MASELQIPAMRGVFGDWVYYVALLPFSEVASRIKRTDEVHTSKLLREMIQRVLTPRSKNIASYLAAQPQRFFNAVVVGVYEGDPEWHGLNVQKSELFDPVTLEARVANSLGILTLNGEEKLFAIDGQHRVEGIKQFIRDLGEPKAKALEDEVCAIFVSHSNDAVGLQKTRRLFATLNRYAKPVSLTEIISLDEDDVVAIACRDLLETHPLFKTGRVSLSKGKALSPTDERNFISLTALYQAMDLYLMRGRGASWHTFKAVRPNSDEAVMQFVRKAASFWDKFLKVIPVLRKVRDLKLDAPLPERLRSPKGGDLLFRSIAPPMIVRCLKLAETMGLDETVFIKRFAKVPRALNKPPWLGVLWDGANMIIGEKNLKVAEYLILWMVDCDPHERRYRMKDLKMKMAMVLNRPEDECVVPEKIK